MCWVSFLLLSNVMPEVRAFMRQRGLASSSNDGRGLVSGWWWRPSRALCCLLLCSWHNTHLKSSERTLKVLPGESQEVKSLLYISNYHWGIGIPGLLQSGLTENGNLFPSTQSPSVIGEEVPVQYCSTFTRETQDQALREYQTCLIISQVFQSLWWRNTINNQ